MCSHVADALSSTSTRSLQFCMSATKLWSASAMVAALVSEQKAAAAKREALLCGKGDGSAAHSAIGGLTGESGGGLAARTAARSTAGDLFAALHEASKLRPRSKHVRRMKNGAA